MPRQIRTLPPDERPDVEVEVDGRWCYGLLHQWVQADDGSWTAQVVYSTGPGQTCREVVGAERVREVDPSAVHDG